MGSRRRWFNGRIRAGMLILVLATLWRWFVHPGPHLSPDLTDAVGGVLYGVSIACMLVGLRANTRPG